MSDSTKEFYVDSVEKYNAEQNIQNKKVRSSKFYLGIAVTGIVISIINARLSSGYQDMSIGEFLRTFLGTITGGSALIYFTIDLIKKYARKIGVDIKIDEIKALFAHHGLVLEDEIAKGKGI